MKYLRSRTCLFFCLLCFAPVKGQAETVPQLLTKIPAQDSGDMSLMSGASTVVFNQSGGAAAVVSNVMLSFFTSSSCTGAATTYTTPNGTSFAISTGTAFGLNAAAAWTVGTNLSLTMSGIQSIGVFLLSTDSNVPQADFTGSTCGTNPSICCVPVSCVSGPCTQTSAIGTQSFALKDGSTETAAIGDPADAGRIACLTSSGGASNMIAALLDNSSGIVWGGGSTSVGTAESATNGSANTAAIYGKLTTSNSIMASTYAAGVCDTYSSGGFSSTWYLPAKNELNCLYTNQTAVGGFSNTNSYWSSTETTASSFRAIGVLNSMETRVGIFGPVTASSQNFASPGTQSKSAKTLTFRVRCVQAFTP